MVHALESNYLLVNTAPVLLIQESQVLHGAFKSAVDILLRVGSAGSHRLLGRVPQVNLAETLHAQIVLHGLLLQGLHLVLAQNTILRRTVLIE